MARGFESKSVADQQEAALARRERDPAQPVADPVRAAQRRKLELTRTDLLRRLSEAEAPAHREMLQRSLAAVDAELAKLG
jgi:hypothetical protein